MSKAATLHTSHGDIEVELYEERVPETVSNFVGLATGEQTWEHPETGEEMTEPLYDDVPFHRVIAEFMLQTGDPTGTGRGGPGYTFEDEFDEELRHDSPGTLSMANRGPDTNGSQFFITLDSQPHLNDRTRCSARSPAGWTWCARSVRCRPKRTTGPRKKSCLNRSRSTTEDGGGRQPAKH